MTDPKRMKLKEQLEELLGTEHVYFQPPENLKMSYPCFVYERRTGDNANANDSVYRFTQTYDLTYISKNPDDGMVEKVMRKFPGVRYDRHFTYGNIHHDTFYLANYLEVN